MDPADAADAQCNMDTQVLVEERERERERERSLLCSLNKTGRRRLQRCRLGSSTPGIPFSF
jgi:hypothetical protein